jgi:hypothetical protein
VLKNTGERAEEQQTERRQRQFSNRENTQSHLQTSGLLDFWTSGLPHHTDQWTCGLVDFLHLWTVWIFDDIKISFSMEFPKKSQNNIFDQNNAFFQ